MTNAKLSSELDGGIDSGIHITPELPLRLGKGVCYGLKWEIANHEQVDIAVGPKLAASGRPEDEGNQHAVGHRPQGFSQHIRNTDRLEE